MRINILPKTCMGKWSVGLIIAFFAFFELLQLLVASGQMGGDTFFSNLNLAIFGMLAGISGIASFFTGFIGVIRKKESSINVFLVNFIELFRTAL